MTFQTTVRNEQGAGIPDLLVSANDEMAGTIFQRSTDGGGYADVAAIGSPVGNRVTLSVLDPQYRYKGLVMGDALVITPEDQQINLVLVPFV